MFAGLEMEGEPLAFGGPGCLRGAVTRLPGKVPRRLASLAAHEAKRRGIAGHRLDPGAVEVVVNGLPPEPPDVDGLPVHGHARTSGRTERTNSAPVRKFLKLIVAALGAARLASATRNVRLIRPLASMICALCLLGPGKT